MWRTLVDELVKGNSFSQLRQAREHSVHDVYRGHPLLVSTMIQSNSSVDTAAAGTPIAERRARLIDSIELIGFSVSVKESLSLSYRFSTFAACAISI